MHVRCMCCAPRARCFLGAGTHDSCPAASLLMRGLLLVGFQVCSSRFSLREDFFKSIFVHISYEASIVVRGNYG